MEEVKCQTQLAFGLSYFSKTDYEKIAALQDETGKTLNGWIRSQKNIRLIN
ncbi:hypothetical protein IPJ72_05695 [Candidatus Peregrinibacteria bacterium]|nr:MAG: hypothetical protein IPJ72_05695 [Candidatus Peregrinibacteria bacterium]